MVRKSKLQKLADILEEEWKIERYWAIADEFSVYTGTISYSRLKAIKIFREANEEYKSWKECVKDGYRTVRIEITYQWEARP